MNKLHIPGIYQTEYSVDQNQQAIIYLFGRDENGKKIIKTVKGFKPYFHLYKDERVLSDSRILSVEPETRTTIDGRETKKIVYSNPKDTYQLREMFKQPLSADIVFHLRFNLDMLETTKTKLRINYLDIETRMLGNFPNPLTTLQPITCITCYDNFEDKYTSFIWHQDIKQNSTEVKDNKTIYHCDNEITMLKEFIKYQSKIQPDIISGWNTSKFDAPYIINRLRKLNIKEVNDLSPIRSVYVTINDALPVIKGVGMVDMFYWYKRFSTSDLPSYSLNSVAQMELGESKLEDIRDPDKLWVENWRKLLEYNIRDVELLKLLEDKKGVIRQLNELRDFVGVNFQDCVYYSRLIDIFMMRKYEDKYIFPSKPPYVKRTEDLFGGHVFVKEGMYDNVIVLDVSGLYPNIIKSFNLSLDTLDKEGEININNVRFTNKKIGMLPGIIDDLFKLRAIYKTEMKKYKPGTDEYNNWFLKSFATKFFVNSVPEDTYVLIKDKNNNPIFIEIKDVDINIHKEALSVNNDTKKLEWKSLLGVFKHKNKLGYLYKIKTDYEQVIEATPNHMLFTYENNKIIQKDCSQLKVGDKLITTLPNLEGSLTQINLCDYLTSNKFNILLTDRKFTKKFRFDNLLKYLEIGKEGWVDRQYVRYRAGVNRGFSYLLKIGAIEICKSIENKCKWRYKTTIFGKDFIKFISIIKNQKRKYIPGYNHKKCQFKLTSTQYNNLPQSIKDFFEFKIGYSKSPYYLPVKFELTKEFLIFLGYYISEGCCGKHIQTIHISQIMNNIYFKNNLYKFATLYRLHISESYIKNKNTIGVSYQFSNIMFKELIKVLCGIGSLNKKLPDFFFNLSKTNQDILVNAYIEGDGHIDKKTGWINTNSISRLLSQQFIGYNPNCRITYDTTAGGYKGYIGYHITFNRKGLLETKINSELTLLPIKKITKIKHKGMLYDLSVKDNENFIGGNLGLFQIHNSCYGSAALPSFRFYSLEVANSITYIGRELVKHCSKKIEEKGYGEVVYMDTDSLAIKSNKEDNVKHGNDIINWLNTEVLNEFVKQFGIEKHTIKFEFEKVYKKLIITAKKRYVGITSYKGGENVEVIENVGIHAKRSDTAKFSRVFQTEVLFRVMNGFSKSDIVEFVEKKIIEMKNTTKYTDIAIPTKLSKSLDKNKQNSYSNPNIPRVKGAIWSNNNLNTNYNEGSKPYMLFVKNKETDVILFDYNEQLIEIRDKFEIDMEKMMERNILLPLESVFQVLGWVNDLEYIRTKLRLKREGQLQLLQF